MQLGLNLLCGGGLELFFECRPIRDDFTIPIDDAVGVDVELHDLGQQQRRRRISDRQVEVDRVQLDRNGDDEHHEQHQHHIDQRSGVDVDHDVGVARSALTYVHCHDAFLNCRKTNYRAE